MCAAPHPVLGHIDSLASQQVLPFAPVQIWPVLADENGYPRWYPPSLRPNVRAVTAS